MTQGTEAGSHDLDAGEIRALLILMGLPKVGPVVLNRLIRRFGSAGAALAADWRSFHRVAGPRFSGRDLRTSSENLARAEEGLTRIRRSGATVRLRGSPGFPPGLEAADTPPAAIFLRGRPEIVERPGIAIVGSRLATETGRDLSRRLAGAIAACGRPVVSGLARGIDAAAHRGALAAGGPTVAVLGCGVDVAYPRMNLRIFRKIAKEGALVSEFAPGEGAAPHHFPRRNRIVAALSEVVVVVEAGRKSGAMITVEHALRQGKDVWVAPGPAGASGWLGGRALIAEGATRLESIDEFITRACGGPARPEEPALPPEEAALFARLGSEPVSVDELASGPEDVPRTLCVLATLEVDGLVESCPGAQFRRSR